MSIRLLASLLSAICLCACSVAGDVPQHPTPYPQPQPPDPAPPGEPSVSAAQEEAEILTVIEYWLERFRTEQNEYRQMHLRYAEDVTVGGEMQILPSPYRTRYRAHAQGWNYWVEVRHPPTLQTCELRDGGLTPGARFEDAGKIWCRRT